MSAITAEQTAANSAAPSKAGSKTSSEDHHHVMSEKEVAMAENPISAKEEHPNAGDADDVYLHGFQLFTVMTSILLFVFLVALDQTIVSTATPVITNDFNAFQDVGWYASAYLLTSTTFQPLFGRLFQSFDIKIVYQAALFIFELGSLICGVAKDSPTFIVGRAIAGCGLAGGYIGSMMLVNIVAPMSKRPLLTSLMGAGYGIGAAIGPLIGGAFTTHATWRWCFYLNLLFYAIVGPSIFIFLKLPKVQHEGSIWKRLIVIDWIGSALLLCSLICILLVFQWGGITYAWGDSKIVGLLVGFVIIGLVFLAEQWYLGERGTIPFRYFKNRTVAFGSLVNFGIASTYFSELYFLPIYFQAVRGSSAIRSGVQLLPFIVAVIFFVTIVGGIMNKTGIYIPILIAGCIITPLSAGMLYFLEPMSPQSRWVGLQFLAGAAPGASWMIPFIAASSTLAPEDIALGSAVVLFFQTLGGSIWASAAQSVFQNKFKIYLDHLPGVDSRAILAKGVSAFREFTPPEQLPEVVDAANRALQRDWIMISVVGTTAFLGVLGMKWSHRIPIEAAPTVSVA